MAHSEKKAACVCPACGNECRLCTGKDTAIAFLKDKDGHVVVPEKVKKRYEDEL